MPKRTSILIGALVLIYVAVRVWRLTDSCLWFDEIFGVHAAEHSWGGMFWFVAQDLIHPPLFYVLLKVWVGIGGESLLWVRLFPVFFSVLALFPFLHLCGELKLSIRATAVALGFLAVNGSLIKYAQEVRMYSMLLCISLFSIWFFARFFYRGKNIWVLTLVNVLLVHTHYFGWLIVVSEVIAVLALQRIKIRHVLVMAGIAAVSFMPWLLTVLRAANAGSDVAQNLGWMKAPGVRSLFELAAAAVEPFYFPVNSIDPASVAWVSVPLIALIVSAAIVWFADWKSVENKDRIWLLAIFVVVPVAAAFLLSWTSPYPVWGVRHLIIVFAPASIVFAVFLGEMEPAVLRWPMIAAVALLMIAGGVRQFATPLQKQIWCGWEESVSSSVDLQGGTIYTFEDLAAYHAWFATRTSNTRIIKVNGLPGVPEDKAYFLPRGMEGAVQVVDAGDIPPASENSAEKVNFVFRDTRWNEHHQPILFFSQKGYKVRQVYESEPMHGTRVFLGEAAR
jgi:uncharacterized membrane protein